MFVSRCWVVDAIIDRIAQPVGYPGAVLLWPWDERMLHHHHYLRLGYIMPLSYRLQESAYNTATINTPESVARQRVAMERDNYESV